ncbi:ZN845-like protein [Mya arenaria]|uniref:ZN845-like protein n=1 Tax=Mya arenaria TaxID=6604 RepID=A0ABY7G7C0_MYAAR|nr:ZN845-like protein [Mya arenaria]
MHTEGKPYSCPFCDAAFARKYALQDHMRIHTGEKPFKCPFCDAAYPRKGALQDHVRIHTGENKCTECGAAFAHKNSLQNHMKIHTGGVVKPHKCEKCVIVILHWKRVMAFFLFIVGAFGVLDREGFKCVPKSSQKTELRPNEYSNSFSLAHFTALGSTGFISSSVTELLKTGVDLFGKGESCFWELLTEFPKFVGKPQSCIGHSGGLAPPCCKGEVCFLARSAT